MSAFSRGLFFRLHALKEPQTIHLFSNRSCPRTFTTSSLLFLAAKKPNAPKAAKRALPKTTPKISTNLAPKTIPTAPSGAPTSYSSYALTLAQKPYSTLLYTAPSHTSFKIASYTTGIFCLSWAYYSINTTFLHPPEGVAVWVPWTFGVVSLGMVWFGTTLLLNTTRIIHSMTAIPKPNNQLQIEIVLRKMFPMPGFPARTIYVSPQDITIPAPMMKPSKVRLTEKDYRYMRLQEKLERDAAREYEETHVISRGLRHMGRPFKNAALAVIRAFNREGFMEMRVKGKIYKLDTTGGWALDGGKAIDRLARLEPHVGKWLS